MNILENISLYPRYATICGYTNHELDDVFAPELAELDRGEIRRRYDGYNWLGEEKVYNPFDILLLFSERQFKAYWFEAGTPEFLIRVMMEQVVSPLDLESRIVADHVVSNFDAGAMSAYALLFQTGYLTITGEERHDSLGYYQLSFPNEAVRVGLKSSFINHVTKLGFDFREQSNGMCGLLIENDFVAFAESIGALFTGIPYRWKVNSQLSHYEAWFAGMFFTFMQQSEADLKLEEATSQGRSDMSLIHGGQIFVFEFKMMKDG